MELRFVPSDPDDDRDLRSLYAWLRDERELRGITRIRPAHAEPGREEMGGVLEAVTAVISAGTALGQLAVAIAAWRESRRSRSTITVVVHEGDRDDALPVLRALEGDQPSLEEE